MTKPKAVMNWSGGKDSSLCLHKVLEADQFDVRCLLTSVNSHWQRISMHGVRRELLHRQAESIGIELVEIMLPEMPSMEVYESEFNTALDRLKDAGITHSIFGDIFLEDLRAYRETQLARKALTGVFPLWKTPTDLLMNEFLDLGFAAVTVCIDANKLDRTFCGRAIDRSFIKDLPDDVDVCGENGEFHSFVFDGPIFKERIDVEIGETVFREYAASENSEVNNRFYFCDLVPNDTKS